MIIGLSSILMENYSFFPHENENKHDLWHAFTGLIFSQEQTYGLGILMRLTLVDETHQNRCVQLHVLDNQTLYSWFNHLSTNTVGKGTAALFSKKKK